ncbi:glycosyltransferase family 2 protein [Agathobaculum sp. LCP25S3_E8]|uniref:glycosyltransferase family 2 protein n=1 Tax=Agathobaculum sp. LCP25S3_E8 TaxID=3438735 RepID=UPI003F92CB50
MEQKKLFSIVLPIYKNEPNLPHTVPFILENSSALFPNYRIEIVMVNDGSPDNSWELMKQYQKRYPDCIRIAKFVHNFGQPLAIRHGIQMAKGDCIGVISADLQEPFELFVDMLEELERGTELVCATREARSDHAKGLIFSQIAHRLFHRYINKQYPVGGFDFFCMTREVANRYLKMKEKNGAVQFQLLWVSASTKFIGYERKQREAGTSGWTFSKKIKLFIDIITTNTYLPLRMMSVAGFFFAFIAFLGSAVIFFTALFTEREVPGWSSLALLTTFFSGVILASLGVIGEYMWRIYDETRERPLYLVEEAIDLKYAQEVTEDEKQ